MLARLLISVLLVCIRIAFCLRYRIQLKGWKELKSYPFDPSRGILFLPNHPAEIDPVILETLLFKHFKPRPLVVEHFYRLKGFRFFMDLVGSLPLPSMDEKANKWRAKRVAKQCDRMVHCLKSGENLLIYPSGRLKTTGLEVIGGASLIHQLMQAYPQAHVVLIRTTGLWGSQFSRALTQRSPDFGQVLKRCLHMIWKNGMFFVPKREVCIEFEVADENFPRSASRLEMNRYLEQWYNHYPEPGPEPLNLIPDLFWKREQLPKVSINLEKEIVSKAVHPVSEETVNKVTTFISNLSKRPLSQVKPETYLAQDLGMDSLDLIQVVAFLDQHFGARQVVPSSLSTVSDVLQATVKEQEETQEKSSSIPFAWPPESRGIPALAAGNTIQEVFLQSAHRGGSQIACVDSLSGAMSYRQLKLRSLILADKLKQRPEKYIGILLPSSSAAYLCILSVLLAGKIPVMLNWTVGTKALDHAVELTGISQVITSMRFLDRLDNEELGRIEELFLFVEDLREEIQFKDTWRALCRLFQSTSSLMKTLGLTGVLPSDPAVILFTSGTESLPKAVPLSHSNILSNQQAALQSISLKENDILYGVLPPFHSFGFSVTGLLPLLSGLRVCYSPDPTDSFQLAQDISRYHPTLFCAAPSFIRALFQRATPSQLSSLRFIVSGAEKTPQELFDYVRENLPQTTLLEGYGITECSPIVTLEREGSPHVGVGTPLPGVFLAILDPETRAALPPGQEGEIYISGPNVFSGYLGRDEQPFFEWQSRSWYLSGDRGFLTPEGNLVLSGRSKRFIKIGGEMIGLSGLEEELLRLAHQKGWLQGVSSQEGPVLALSAREQQADKPFLILFTTFPVTVEEVNRGLKQSGFGRIVKIAHVCELKEIPLMGTGKTDYRFLDELKMDEMK